MLLPWSAACRTLLYGVGALAALAACGATTAPPRRPRSPVARAPATPYAVDAATAIAAPVAPRVADAPQRARAAVTAAVPTPEAASWIPSHALRAVADATGALPAPSRVAVNDGVATWELLYDASVDASRVAGACERVTRAMPSLACADDVVPWAGADRARIALAWRAGERASTGVSFVQPLRAIARVGEGLCVVHAERTLRTVDVTVRAARPEALGRALAWITVAPLLSDLIMVRSEPRGEGVEAVLSWPLGRATGPADFGDVPWPTRCDGRSTVGAEAMPGTVPVARERIAGAASGAVVRVGRREWIVTVGDRAASVDVVAVRADGVSVRLRGRAAPATLRWPAAPR